VNFRDRAMRTGVTKSLHRNTKRVGGGEARLVSCHEPIALDNDRCS
jgi:hypothetical protein